MIVLSREREWVQLKRWVELKRKEEELKALKKEDEL